MVVEVYEGDCTSSEYISCGLNTITLFTSGESTQDAVDDADNDPANELQTLPPDGSVITQNLFFFDDDNGAFRAGILDNSSAWGTANLCQGSVAFGQNVMTCGEMSQSFGNHLNNNSFASIVIGQYNIGEGDPASWVGTDPLFEKSEMAQPVKILMQLRF